MTARENSSKLSMLSWFVSSWSNTRRAGLSAAVAPLGACAVDGLVVAGVLAVLPLVVVLVEPVVVELVLPVV